MEITICDPYSFREKITLDHEITCKELKDKINSQFGRDTSNCTIYFNKEPLKDYKIIQLDSSIPYIIIDGNIEKTKNHVDYNNSYYKTSRFQTNPHYKKADRTPTPHFALLFNPTNAFDPYSDSSDENEEDNPLFYLANENNSSDTNNENTDDQEEVVDLNEHNDTDSDNELSNNSSSENDENDIDNEIITPATHNSQLILIGNQNAARRRPGSNYAVFQPSYQPLLVHPMSGFGQRQNPQRRPPQQQAESQTDTHLMDLFGLPDSDEIIYDESVENDNDENDNDNYGLNIDLTPEEKETVRRICRENERFDRSTIIQVFEACGRDAETTTQCLSTM